MKNFIKALITGIVVTGLIAACGKKEAEEKTAEAKMESAKPAEPMASAEEKGSDKTADAGHGHDYRTFMAGGDTKYGQIGDSYTADLVMYLAGNQFMVMEELIKDFP